MLGAFSNTRRTLSAAPIVLFQSISVPTWSFLPRTAVDKTCSGVLLALATQHHHVINVLVNEPGAPRQNPRWLVCPTCCGYAAAVGSLVETWPESWHC